jgi:FMN phosphatase YigB (HAD superfamily)
MTACSAPVAALLFDFGGTLDADGVAWKERFHAFFAGGSLRPDEFDRAFYAADDALVGAVARDLSFRETVEQLSRNLVGRLGADPAIGPRIADGFYQSSLAKVEASAQVLGRLAKRYRLGIVSNFYGNLEAICEETGLGRHLSVVVDSACVGFEKPDPRIFETALAALAATPDSAIFVGDSLPRDMEGARRLGMRHVYVTPGGAAACCPEDRVIGSVAELPEVLP